MKNYLKHPTKLTAIFNFTHVYIWPKSTSDFNDTTNNFKVCLVGRFECLKKIVISENSLESIDPDILYGVKNLRYLDISKNRLGNEIAKENFAKSVLDILNILEILLAGNNGITFFLWIHSVALQDFQYWIYPTINYQP